MVQIREALTAEMMSPIMALMNTRLGFKTDRDPKQIDSKTGKPFEPYAVEVVKECFIESRLRGYQPIGNEWNIISSQFYACKEGLDRMVRRNPKITDYVDRISPPTVVNEKYVRVRCQAAWKQDGIPKEIKDLDLDIRLNAGMGHDAVKGKAQRKLYAEVLRILTGKSSEDGEVGEPAIDVASEIQKQPSETFKPKAGPMPSSGGDPAKN